VCSAQVEKVINCNWGKTIELIGRYLPKTLFYWMVSFLQICHLLLVGRINSRKKYSMTKFLLKIHQKNRSSRASPLLCQLAYAGDHVLVYKVDPQFADAWSPQWIFGGPLVTSSHHILRSVSPTFHEQLLQTKIFWAFIVGTQCTKV